MKRKINIIEAAMKFPQVPIAITVIMVLAGLISLMTMPRSEDPRVTVRTGLVVAFYPGSDEVQMEKEVTESTGLILLQARASTGTQYHIE